MTTSSYDSLVNSFYLAYYGRPADPAGLTYWSTQLAASNGDLGTISAAFSTSAEATARFGTETTSERISDIYSQLFNRAPDAAGLAYWLDAVNKGNAGEADVALALLNGAQGTDHGIATLRAQAMDAFTAQVQATGSAYSGEASIEAARILVRAVTLDSSADDVAALVKASVSFAATASANPGVVEALASGGTLLALFDTARGSADPVALAQALAGTAAAAAGNPTTLAELLHGGGMAQVLKVMPAGASLQDVVDALASGGLAAVIDVVYPTASTPPVVVTPAMHLTFQSVTHGPGDIHTNSVTGTRIADVVFSYTGKDLTSTQHIEYSLDGTSWNVGGLTVSSINHTVTIAHIDLLTQDDTTNNLTTTVSVRVVDGNGVVTSPASHAVTYDHYAAAPQVALANDNGEFSNDSITNNAALTVTGVETGATLQYADVTSSLQNPEWNNSPPPLHEGENMLFVRQVDTAGNVSGASLIDFTYDSLAPGQPVIALAFDSGVSNHDGVTGEATILVSGLDTAAATATSWEFSTDGGTTWNFGSANGNTGIGSIDMSSMDDGVYDVQVREYDAAGNVGAASATLHVTLDTSAPLAQFDHVEGGTGHGTTTAAGIADVVFNYDGDYKASDTVEYKIGSGAWTTLSHDDIDTVAQSFTLKDVDLTTADPVVQIRTTDLAGNESNTASVTIDGPYAMPATLHTAITAEGLSVTSSVAGAIELQPHTGDAGPLLNTEDGGAVAGTAVLVGEQTSASALGSVFVAPAVGDHIADTSGQLYEFGSPQADDLYSNTDAATLWGFAGDDGLSGSSNGDHLYGGDGDDQLFGHDGNDTLDGGSGGNYIEGGKGVDSIDVSHGTNFLSYDYGDSTIDTGIDVVTFADTLAHYAGSQTFGFPADPSDISYVSNAVNPTDSSPAALLNALNAAYQNEFGADSGSHGLIVTFANHDNYLVVDGGNGTDGIVDGQDTVIKLVGYIADADVIGGQLVFNAPV